MSVSIREHDLGMGSLEASRAQMTSSDGYNTGTRPSMQTDVIDPNAISSGTSSRSRGSSVPNLDLSSVNQSRVSRPENVSSNSYVQPRRASVSNDRNAAPQQNGSVSRSRSINSQTTRPHRLDPSVRHSDRLMFQAVTRENVFTHDSSRAHIDSSRSPYHERSRSHREHNGFRGVSSATTNRSDATAADESYIVPVMPMPIAVLCCILNFLIPGFGSILASICVFCCARTDDMKGREKLCTCCTVFGIGVLQLLLVACFLIGWIWSCIWGVSFIGVSASYYGDGVASGADDERFQQRMAPSNNPAYRQARGRTPLPAPQVVVDQPFPGVRYEDLERREEARHHRSSRPRRSPRLPLTPSNLIYPMRAPSNIAYSSPPPSYTEAVAHLPGQVPDAGGSRGDMERPPSYHSTVSTRHGRPSRSIQAGDTIHEEGYR